MVAAAGMMVIALVSAIGPARLSAQVQVPRDPAAGLQTVGSGVIRGRVMRGEDNQPLRGARVWLRAEGLRNAPSTTTDATGRFELSAIPEGEFILSAAKVGYVTVELGETSSGQGGVPLALARGETVERIDITLRRGGAVAGSVIDEGGEPVVGAIVRVLRQRYVQGRRRFVAAFDADWTDDRGMFRLYGIAPGRYVLNVTVARPLRADVAPEIGMLNSLPTLGSISFFYPGATTAAQAQLLDVRAGEELNGLVVTYASPRLATISGTIRMGDGQVPPGRLSAAVAQPLPFTSGLQSSSVVVKTDGSFSIPDLPPGPYMLTANVFPQDGHEAESMVTLNGADLHVPLVLGRAPVATGRVTFGGATPPPSAARIVQFVNENPDSPVGYRGAQMRADWTFEAAGIFGRNRIKIQPPAGWRLAGIRQGDADITDAVLDFSAGDISGIDIALTNRLAQALIVVKDRNGREIRNATVVLFAEDRAKWGPDSRFVGTARADRTGRIVSQTLPPGQYLVAAVTNLEPGDEMDPAVLERLRSEAAPVTLRDGEAVSVEVVSSEL
jgi:hypothetical protein